MVEKEAKHFEKRIEKKRPEYRISINHIDAQ